ncbi:MAG TPA: hypothetical protein VN280_12945 [Variovorax sp.]|nr:hypothetical protein [Variovorax sp.]
MAIQLLLAPLAKCAVAEPAAHNDAKSLYRKRNDEGLRQIFLALGPAHFVPLPNRDEHDFRDEEAERKSSGQNAKQSDEDLHEIRPIGKRHMGLPTIKLLLPPFAKCRVAEPAAPYQSEELNGERDHVRLA